MALTINILYKGEKGNISSSHKTNNKTKNAPIKVRFVL